VNKTDRQERRKRAATVPEIRRPAHAAQNPYAILQPHAAELGGEKPTPKRIPN